MEWTKVDCDRTPNIIICRLILEIQVTIFIILGSMNKPVSPGHLTISVPPVRKSSPNGRPSTGSIGSDFGNTDVQEIVGGGCKNKRLNNNSSLVCGNCCIQ